MSGWEEYLKKQTESRLKLIVEKANNDVFTISGKEYKYHKIPTSKYWELEAERAELDGLKDIKSITMKLASIYEKCAAYYLQMPHEEYENSDWEEMKLVLDACAHRTLYGPSFLDKSSTTGSGSTAK